MGKEINKTEEVLLIEDIPPPTYSQLLHVHPTSEVLLTVEGQHPKSECCLSRVGPLGIDSKNTHKHQKENRIAKVVDMQLACVWWLPNTCLMYHVKLNRLMQTVPVIQYTLSTNLEQVRATQNVCQSKRH